MSGCVGGLHLSCDRGAVRCRLPARLWPEVGFAELVHERGPERRAARGEHFRPGSVSTPPSTTGSPPCRSSTATRLSSPRPARPGRRACAATGPASAPSSSSETRSTTPTPRSAAASTCSAHHPAFWATTLTSPHSAARRNGKSPEAAPPPGPPGRRPQPAPPRPIRHLTGSQGGHGKRAGEVGDLADRSPRRTSLDGAAWTATRRRLDLRHRG